jgi:hypothetical protein
MKNRKYIKTFEAQLADNEAVPNGRGRMNDIKNQARQEIGNYQRQGSVVGGGEMFRIIREVSRIEQQHKDVIEALALEIINSEYQGMLDDVDVDIKLSEMGKVTSDMEEADEDFELKPTPDRRPLTPEMKQEVDKRKVANLITQGESKNAINLFHLFKDQIDEIHPDLFDMYDKIFKSNEAQEWMMPEQGIGQMMYNNQRNVGGVVSVGWGDEEEEKEAKEEKQRTAEEIIADIQNGGDLHNNEEDISDLLSTGKPSIKVRAANLPLLVHETIKGIYELIASKGIPDDENLAQIVMDQTDTLDDEAEDLKYGRYIKNDFVAFINENPKSDNVPNIKEFVFGEMMTLPAPQFIRLFRGIMEQTPDARRQIDEIIDGILAQFDEYNNYDEDNDDMFRSSNYDDNYGENEEDNQEEPVAPQPQAVAPSNEKEEEDYSRMNKRDLQTALDDALDAGDFATVRKISPFLERRNHKLTKAKLLENKRRFRK